MSPPGPPSSVNGQPYGGQALTTTSQSPGRRLVRTNTCGTSSTSYMSYSEDQGTEEGDQGGPTVSEMYGSEATTVTPAAAAAAAAAALAAANGGRGGRGGQRHPGDNPATAGGGAGWVGGALLFSPPPIPTPAPAGAAAAGGVVGVRRGKDKTTAQGAAFWAGTLREVEVACGDKDGMFDLHT
jgi:hypothetical protein